MFVTASSSYDRNTLNASYDNLCATLDGSGFYSCDITGQYLYLSKSNDPSTSTAYFTICDIEVYEEHNLIGLEVRNKDTTDSVLH